MTRSAHVQAYRFCSAVALGGVLLLAAVVVHGPGGAFADQPLRVLVLGLCVFVGEFFPLQVPRGRGEEHLTFSSTFSFGLLLVGGLWPAVVAQSVAVALPDIRARRPAWRILFNVGQYVLALGAADLVLRLADPTLITNGRFSAAQLPAILIATGAFWLVNIGLVGVAVALWQGVRLRDYFRQDVIFSLVTGMALLGLSPVVVRWSEFSLAAFPVFALPLYAVYSGGRHAVASGHQAKHDALTGLPNRLLFYEVVAMEAGPGQADDGYAILLLDLDRFKDINDTLGHAWGDRLLVEVAARVGRVVREQDTLARLGGDEFAVLLPRCTDPGDAWQTATRIAEVLEGPIDMGDLSMEVDLSIGIAYSTPEHGDVEEILRRADVAMYHAKGNRLGIHVFDAAIDNFHPDRLGLAGELRGGIQGGELVLHYQPKLDLGTDRVVSMEALVRWQHPRLGLLQPDTFIELAEHTGVIRSLTWKVIELALAQCGRWRAEGLPMTVAVNVSMRSLREPRFPVEVAELIGRTGARADWLVLEITENMLMADPQAVMAVLRGLDEMGVGLSIDDFGTGYSSLSYLRELPVGELKIDRSFVTNLLDSDSDNSAVIVRSTVELAHNLGLRIVAEGVEDRATMDWLREMGCDEIQGYYLSRPLPAPELTVWLGERPSAPQPALKAI
jgi:diguanylate cyclase